MNHDSLGYWKATLGLLTKVLVIWFLVSFGAGNQNFGRTTVDFDYTGPSLPTGQPNKRRRRGALQV